ncbi:hypothetical protein HNQ51_001956 [Inhella inkyongensis]|uniref:Uncharacterized protein n=1 Tax=Inhella inkyongensis TaxID=392593 RepID=A0A840S509_9BURK|nr:hypothetical protein [Inhella inkyongensis]MBB5204642.1 hypothetical protein [Inhella inkyongensis]
MQLLTTSSHQDAALPHLSFGVSAKLPSRNAAAPNPATLYNMGDDPACDSELGLPECDSAWACTTPMAL